MTTRKQAFDDKIKLDNRQDITRVCHNLLMAKLFQYMFMAKLFKLKDVYLPKPAV